jgi:SAM-dependent methyltransferase
MREAVRVLKPGGVFAVYDVMRTGPGDLVYPLPWSKVPETSFVAPPEDYRAAAEAAGFTVEAERARREFALEFFAKQTAILRAKSGPPPLGLHLVMGPEAPQMIANMVANIEAGRIAPVELILRRAD